MAYLNLRHQFCWLTIILVTKKLQPRLATPKLLREILKIPLKKLVAFSFEACSAAGENAKFALLEKLLPIVITNSLACSKRQ